MIARLSKIAGHAVLAAGLATAVGVGPAVAEQISITIEHVRALDKIDALSQADFFAVATIDGKVVKSAVLKRGNEVKPNWVLSAPVGRGIYDVKLALFDKDVTKDESIDINRVDGKRDLDFQVDTRNCRIRGFAQGYSCRRVITRAGAEKKGAEIQFSVDVQR